jgi:hypothetical protein
MISNSCNETLQPWRTSYKAALAETDVQRLTSRIEEARKALVVRSRELFSGSANYDSDSEAIHDAMYALKALENCLQLNTKDRRQTSRTA